MVMVMTERFELTINSNGQLDIIDHIESKEKNAICIYNDLGVHPFSSAKAVCRLLNEQDKKIQRCKLAYNQLTSYVDANFDEYMTQKKLNERIRELEVENRQLKSQLQTNEEDDICIKCKHHYLIKYPESSKYYISKCKKEHEECSKEYIRFCEDFEFELEGDYE